MCAMVTCKPLWGQGGGETRNDRQTWISLE